jgi:hypothetical protein
MYSFDVEMSELRYSISTVQSAEGETEREGREGGGQEEGDEGEELSDGEKEETGNGGVQGGEQADPLKKEERAGQDGTKGEKEKADGGVPDPEIILVAPTPARPCYIPNRKFYTA